MRTDLPQTQKAAQTSSFCRTSNRRGVISGCGPSSKLSRISPRPIPTSWIRCQIVHCARNLCANRILHSTLEGSEAKRSFGSWLVCGVFGGMRSCACARTYQISRRGDEDDVPDRREPVPTVDLIP